MLQRRPWPMVKVPKTPRSRPGLPHYQQIASYTSHSPSARRRAFQLVGPFPGSIHGRSQTS